MYRFLNVQQHKSRAKLRNYHQLLLYFVISYTKVLNVNIVGDVVIKFAVAAAATTNSAAVGMSSCLKLYRLFNNYIRTPKKYLKL